MDVCGKLCKRFNLYPKGTLIVVKGLKHKGKASLQLCNVLRSPDSTAAINTSRSAIALYHSPTDLLLSFSGHFGKTALLSFALRASDDGLALVVDRQLFVITASH